MSASASAEMSPFTESSSEAASTVSESVSPSTDSTVGFSTFALPARRVEGLAFSASTSFSASASASASSVAVALRREDFQDGSCG